MTSWKIKKLSSIGFFAKGSGIPKDSAQSGDLPAVRYGELYTSFDVFIRSTKSYINQITAADATKITKGDILFAGSGETIDEIGKSAVYILEQEGHAGGDIVILRPDSKQCAAFLGYILNSEVARRELRRLGQGQSVVHIYRKDLESLELALPEKREQERIVSVLETWDEYIEKLEQKIALKEQLKKGLMQQLLNNPESNWHTVQISMITDLLKDGTHGTHKDASEGPALLSAKDVKNGKVSVRHDSRKISAREFNQIHKAYSLSTGDVLLTIVGTLGRVAQIESYQNNFTFQRSVAILRFSEQVDSRFMYYLLSAQSFKKELLKRESKGAQGGVYLGEIGKIKIGLPDKSTQIKIASILDTISNEKEFLEKLINNGRAQKKYLLKNLITGTIRTPENLTPKGAE